MKCSWTLRKGMLFFLALSLLLITGCNNNGEGDTSSEDTDFDIAIAVELARLSLQAYQQLDDHTADRSFILPAPYRLHETLLTSERFAGDLFSGTEEVPIGFIATADKAIYVVFRGTQTITEWLNNVQFPQVIFDLVTDGGQTHQGFTAVYESVRDTVITTVNALIASDTYTTLYVTGHSLGGALAVLAALELRERTALEPIMYNFAAPRVGDPAFRQRYREAVSNSWRTVNTHDIVPTLPPTTVLALDGITPKELLYTHVSTENAITFGSEINDPLDVLNIGANHDLCTYYSTLCDQTDAPDACKVLAGGAGECNP
jgi:triacylglycerol lipase